MQPDGQTQGDRPENHGNFIKGETHRRRRHRQNNDPPARVSCGDFQQRPTDQGRVGQAEDHRQMFIPCQP